MAERQPSPRLLEAVARDLRPVRPLAAPWRRALALLPFGFLLLVGVPGFWGFRAGLPELGIGLSWGLSALQALAGLAVVGVALREGVPGRKVSPAVLLATLAASMALFLAITWVTQLHYPVTVRPAVRVRFVWECLGIATVSGIPALAAVAWLAWRLLPNRPWIAGAVAGLGAGLMADAGMRLFCWVSEPEHVVLAHGGAILILMLAGALLSRFAEAWKGWRSAV